MPFDFNDDSRNDYSGGWKSSGGFQNPPKETGPRPSSPPRGRYTPPTGGRSLRPVRSGSSLSFSFIAKVALVVFVFIIGYGILKNMSVITYFIGEALAIIVFLVIMYLIIRAFIFGGRRRRW